MFIVSFYHLLTPLFEIAARNVEKPIFVGFLECLKSVGLHAVMQTPWNTYYPSIYVRAVQTEFTEPWARPAAVRFVETE